MASADLALVARAKSRLRPSSQAHGRGHHRVGGALLLACHRALDGFDDAGTDRTVILELLGAVVNGDTRATTDVLIIGALKPWRLCTSAQERLDGMNGLMLTPDADWLFDRGFVSFEDGGEVLVSPRVDQSDLRRLGFETLTHGQFELAEAPNPSQAIAFPAERRGYLAYHRSQVFIG